MKIKAPKPFTFEGESNRAVLLLHGFTGSSNDVRMLGRYLQKQGYTSHAPVFPGHGVPPEQLMQTDWHDWWAAVEEGYQHLVDRGFTTIAVCGLSLGGLLSLKVGYTFDVNGIVPMCAPVMQQGMNDRLYQGVVDYAKQYKQFEKKDEETIEEEMDEFETMPLDTLASIDELIFDVRDRLANIKQPIKVIQAGQDDLVPPENADVIYEEVGSKHRDRVLYENAPHVITLWEEKERLHEEIVAFLDSLEWSS
ncbi:carboxylesterase [Geomicrobium sp. JCM 19037]|uniref:alpha/beta hydrolase n=1 Tax=unclassified Geomicrobium TaxID=2628951 RepID=UPI00045F10EF|nr:alpha/beta fold hydrolase [Geomicrobium sp. JCM 19037]GAK05582.1 carboxylesterase [Geomicrobium sp. JCM 19037]